MKLTQSHAMALVNNAHKVSGRSKEYRFGQSLFNNMPQSLQDEITNTEKDFYHIEDSTVAVNMFYEHCVECE